MKKVILSLVVAFAVQFSFAQEDADFKKDVLKLIEKSGAGGQMNAAKKQILTMIPQEKQAAFLIEFETFLPKVSDATAKVYMEIYTKEDVKAILAFYDSPVGKKMSEKAELIADKSQEAMMSLQGDMQELVMKYMN